MHSAVNRLSRLLMAVCVGFLIATTAEAACNCVCVNGLNRPLCSSISDIKPVCPPRVCPQAPQSISPIDTPQLRPPTGTQSCASDYIYNRYTQRYEWRQVCE